MVVVSDSVGPVCQGVILPCEHGLDPAGRTSCRSYRPAVIQYESSQELLPQLAYMCLYRKTWLWGFRLKAVHHIAPHSRVNSPEIGTDSNIV